MNGNNESNFTNSSISWKTCEFEQQGVTRTPTAAFKTGAVGGEANFKAETPCCNCRIDWSSAPPQPEAARAARVLAADGALSPAPKEA